MAIQSFQFIRLAGGYNNTFNCLTLHSIRNEFKRYAYVVDYFKEQIATIFNSSFPQIVPHIFTDLCNEAEGKIETKDTPKFRKWSCWFNEKSLDRYLWRTCIINNNSVPVSTLDPNSVFVRDTRDPHKKISIRWDEKSIPCLESWENTTAIQDELFPFLIDTPQAIFNREFPQKIPSIIDNICTNLSGISAPSSNDSWACTVSHNQTKGKIFSILCTVYPSPNPLDDTSTTSKTSPGSLPLLAVMMSIIAIQGLLSR